ncbi:nuclear GTPase SLIP-GC-like [Periophthalmus magnuspinnatus]|uniref:nuclear GTPase SLIP-GC-like n=1 Tax=Periophthalmus magnuspinnatus TaxID=409849 RepID=UPI0024362EAE|nr:nuclear GTPase SLIP-GC-like [Periophthalmus magnuspinnatus]
MTSGSNLAKKKSRSMDAPLKFECTGVCNMEEFVASFLTKWGLSDLIETFKGRKRQQVERGAAVPSHQEVLRSDASVIPPEDLPSSSKACGNEQKVLKRKCAQTQTNSSAKIKRQCDTEPDICTDDLILKEVKDLMTRVRDRLSDHTNTKLNVFLRKNILDLNTDKKDLVGVFGKTGAGKSTLINAIVEEKGLLPTGSVEACTSVMIKVEANTKNKIYEAEIEFISKEEWEDELWSLKNLLDEISDEEMTEDEEYGETTEKMTAFYGDEWRDKSKNLMKPTYFKEIREFFLFGRKIIQVDAAQELAEKLLKYTKSENGQRRFWPLVKCVTVRVPNNDILKHITLVDLPGSGDRNKSRDQMWKRIVASCSTVWVVSEMTRAASDRDGWEILESTSKLMGNGGECQNIYFICTKCDDQGADDGTTENILERNQKAKDIVRKEFNKLPKVKKQFRDDCFDVFTVSSKEFFNPKKLKPVQTEIPKLQELLRSLNNQHDQTLNYVRGAYGILSLIKGAKVGNMDPVQTAQVQEKLNENIERELQKVRKSMKDMLEVFEECLSNGVEESKNKSEDALYRKLNPKKKGGGSSFHRPLKCALQNNGVHKTKKTQINLNEAISKFLTDSIDEEFRRSFPNDAESGPLYEVIHAFSVDTNRLAQQYKTFELQLTFISTEVSKVKTKLCKEIRDRKKLIYSSVTETVKETMQKCYKEAATFTGRGCLEKMKHTVQKHLHDVKGTMFDEAKAEVLCQLEDLKDDVQKQLSDTLQESIELSFKTDLSIPDFENEFNLVKKHFDDLKMKKT